MKAGIRGVSLLPGEWKKNMNSLCEEIDLFTSLKRFVQVLLVATSPILQRPAVREPRHAFRNGAVKPFFEEHNNSD